MGSTFEETDPRSGLAMYLRAWSGVILLLLAGIAIAWSGVASGPPRLTTSPSVTLAEPPGLREVRQEPASQFTVYLVASEAQAAEVERWQRQNPLSSSTGFGAGFQVLVVRSEEDEQSLQLAMREFMSSDPTRLAISLTDLRGKRPEAESPVP